MKLKKLGTTAIAVILVLGSGIANTTYAIEAQKQTLTSINYQTIIPFWTNISDITPYISVDGTTLYPEVYIEAKSSSGSIRGTMYLEKYSSGSWTSVTSWNFSGTGNVFLSKSYTGTSGVRYRTKVVVTVDGERAVATSESCRV